MVEPLRNRQTKGAETDMPGLPPPRHISTLPYPALSQGHRHGPVYARKRASRPGSRSTPLRRKRMRVYSVRLPALPPKPFWMGSAQFLSFSWRNSSDDKSQFHTRGLIVLLAKTMQLR